ncbi:hypothetical protein [Streptomyces silvisoli]|uniref:Sensor histidine kinase n=1 Tax=Streptomyces silvisoli TaxID=3034235 RepID=A0ABT5ZRC4_9ACTN|nr:hypothetical protein [Streptomyces silvisoli]MDF3292377.1 hypothetical protein [Streptomyces silvisoli]
MSAVSKRALKPESAAASLAVAYGALYVAITLLLRHSVRVNWLLFPILAIGGVTLLLQRVDLWTRAPVRVAAQVAVVALAIVAAVLS